MDKPNLILLVTDQQRAPQHWPTDQAWLDELMPNDAELRRTGISFNRAFTATAMCSPSRASFLTGTYPSRHGVTLTMTEGDLFPDQRNLPDVLRTVARLARSGEVPRKRLANRFVRGLLRLGPKSGREPELPPGIDTLATHLRERGYHVALKGKWHLSKPVNGREWTDADPERIERDYGFADWEPPDAGGDAKAETFGGGNAGTTHEGWDTDYTRQVERWLARQDLPEPFCLVVSLVNPHDVLGYPSQYEVGGYTRSQFRDLGVTLPPTVHEDLRDKPTVHSLMKLGQTAYIGALDDDDARRDYVNFYAYLHKVVDEKIGRLLSALGDASDPGSLRSRTVIARTSDHGELGMSHGGLRQKMFNDYEETIRVPLVISNPVLFPRGARATRWCRSSTSCRRCSACRASPASRSASTASTSARSSTARPSRCATPCCSPTTTTRPPRRSRTCPASPTGSAACATPAGSTRSTSTPTARPRPNTSSTTSRPTPTRSATSWASTRAAE